MKKNFISWLIIISFIFAPFYGVEALTLDDSYKGIVKIKLFSLSDDGFLVNISYGSGVIISSDGLILTNYHVVSDEDEYNGSEKEVAYQICLTVDKNEEPECKYTARFIASDKDSDMAILKIKNISGLSTDASYSYLDISSSDVEANDNLTVLGYPSIGGDTITLTQGVVSGTVNKYDMDWIKTDADISFGNSGGAGVNEDGDVIGIASRSHSDMLGSMGYLININSVNDWINKNKNNSEKISSLENRLIDFVKKEATINDSNLFTNTVPALTLTKPDSWEYLYSREDRVVVNNESDSSGGYVALYLIKFPFIASVDDIETIFKLDNLFFLSLLDIVKSEEVMFGDRAGRKITSSVMGSISKAYYIPHGEHVINIEYDYGEDDKDKELVDGIINSLGTENYASTLEIIDYYNNDFHGFSIDLSDGEWVAMESESLTVPIMMYNNNDKSAVVIIGFTKRDDDTMGLTNNEIYKIKNNELESTASIFESLGITFEPKSSLSYTNIGNVNDAIMLEYGIEKDGKNILSTLEYHIYFDDKVMSVEFSYIGDSKDYIIYKNSIEDALSGLVVSGYSQKNITEEILEYSSNSTPETPETPENNESISSISNKSLYDSISGSIMLKVEDNGEAYYVHPKNQEMHYLGRPDDAFNVMRDQGVGITNEDLYKIPVGVANNGGVDSDNDGLSDYLEETLGLDASKADTDGDGYSDKQELEDGYSPWGEGRQDIDNSFANAQSGRILLQVEKDGEAWYINPEDGKRYFLGRPADAFSVMRNLGRGMSNSNFDSL